MEASVPTKKHVPCTGDIQMLNLGGWFPSITLVVGEGESCVRLWQDAESARFYAGGVWRAREGDVRGCDTEIWL